MGFHLVKSKVVGKDGENVLKAPLVIDGKKFVGPLQVFPEDFNGGPGLEKQEWEFNPDPAGSGFFFIQNRVNGSYITNSHFQSGPKLSANATLIVTEIDNYLWRFIKDPAGSGYCFIVSKLNGYVIEIQHDSPQQGTAIVTAPIKSSGNAAQLWLAPFPHPFVLPTTLEWLNLGTGSGTSGSDSTECAYTANLEIAWDGSCHFWGSYTNRGDTFASTAPPQDFGVAIVVHDIAGNGYSFSYGGFVWSAPQAGSTDSWDYTGTSKVISENWVFIALRNQASNGYENQAIQGAGLGGAGSPGDTSTTIFGLLQAAVTGAGGGSIGTVFTQSKNDIFSAWDSGPGSTTVASGGRGEEGGSLPPGWQPSGDTSVGA